MNVYKPERIGGTKDGMGDRRKEKGLTIIRSSSFAPGDLGPLRSSCSLLLNLPAFGLDELTPLFDAYHQLQYSICSLMVQFLVSNRRQQKHRGRR